MRFHLKQSDIQLGERRSSARCALALMFDRYGMAAAISTRGNAYLISSTEIALALTLPKIMTDTALAFDAGWPVPVTECEFHLSAEKFIPHMETK